VGSWGNSGVWDNTPIVNNGSISAKVNSPQDKTEQMIGLTLLLSTSRAVYEELFILFTLTYASPSENLKYQA
jgi:hypothetical protein